jgi:hypothetical protein
VADQLAASWSGDLLIRDWTRQNRTWFAAVQVEKRMMFIILTLIVAVAAFNLVSTLVMTVPTSAPTSPSCARWAPARQHHGHLRGAGRDGRRDRHAGRAGAGAGRWRSTST